VIYVICKWVCGKESIQNVFRESFATCDKREGNGEKKFNALHSVQLLKALIIMNQLTAL